MLTKFAIAATAASGVSAVKPTNPGQSGATILQKMKQKQAQRALEEAKMKKDSPDTAFLDAFTDKIDDSKAAFTQVQMNQGASQPMTTAGAPQAQGGAPQTMPAPAAPGGAAPGGGGASDNIKSCADYVQRFSGFSSCPGPGQKCPGGSDCRSVGKVNQSDKEDCMVCVEAPKPASSSSWCGDYAQKNNMKECTGNPGSCPGGEGSCAAITADGGCKVCIGGAEMAGETCAQYAEGWSKVCTTDPDCTGQYKHCTKIGADEGVSEANCQVCL